MYVSCRNALKNIRGIKTFSLNDMLMLELQARGRKEIKLCQGFFLLIVVGTFRKYFIKLFW